MKENRLTSMRPWIIAAAIILALGVIMIPIGIIIHQKAEAPETPSEEISSKGISSGEISETKDTEKEPDETSITKNTEGELDETSATKDTEGELDETSATKDTEGELDETSKTKDFVEDPFVQSGSYKSSIDYKYLSDRGPLYWHFLSNNPEAREEVSFSFEGETYIADYTGYSIPPNEFDRGIDYYSLDPSKNPSKNGRNPYSISTIMIERETGKLRSIGTTGSYRFVDPNTVDTERYRSRAKEIASNYIKVDEYELSERTFSYSPTDYTGYEKYAMCIYIFSKMAGDYKTRDMVCVCISPTGDFRGIIISDTGRFDNLNAELKIDEEKLNESIKEEIDKEYDPYNYQYDIYDQWLTASFDGKLMIVSEVYLKKTGEYNYEYHFMVFTDI